MTAYVPVSKKTLQWILDNSEDSKRTAKQRKNVLEWMNNEDKKPTFKKVKAASSNLGIPFGYFFLKEPPKEEFPILEFRTINSKKHTQTSREFIDTYNKMVQIQEWAKNDRREHDQDSLPFIGSLDSSKNINEFITFIYKLLQLSDHWFENNKDSARSYNDLKKKISDLGVIVMSSGCVRNNPNRSLDLDEFRAFALSDNLAPLIFINSKDSYAGRLFSLIHEFIHLLMGSDDLYNTELENPEEHINKEAFVNRVTAEILVPNHIFMKEWNELTEPIDNRIYTLSRYFRCSSVVIARRALDNHLIEKSDYSKIVKVSKSNFQKSQKGSGGNFYNTKAYNIDQNFLKSLDRSLYEGRTQYTEAYFLTDTNRKTFDRLIDKSLGGNDVYGEVSY